jgi:hypothetical protein
MANEEKAGAGGGNVDSALGAAMEHALKEAAKEPEPKGTPEPKGGDQDE